MTKKKDKKEFDCQEPNLYLSYSHSWQKFPDLRQDKRSAERTDETVLTATEWLKEKL